MKNFILPALFLLFLGTSCSTDDSVEAVLHQEENITYFKAKSNIQQNPANAYDYAGRLHVAILNDYLLNAGTSIILPDIINNVENIAENNTDFVTYCTGTSNIETSYLQWVLSNASYPDVIISDTGTSTYGKMRLNEFTGLLNGYQTATYETVYNSIVNFEDAVIADIRLNSTDKRVILLTTSVGRYSIAYNKDKNRGWNRTKAGILAAMSGTNDAEAVIASVTANISS